jgi:hypothetical protein
VSAVRLEDTPGVTAVAVYAGRRMPVAECARCGQRKPIRARGLCGACSQRSRLDGTISDYGYTRALRLADYAWLRLEAGCTLREAAARVGVSERTALRYEAALREAP